MSYPSNPYNRFSPLALAAIAFCALILFSPELHAQIAAPTSFDNDPTETIKSAGSTIMTVIAVSVTVASGLATAVFFLMASFGNLNMRLARGVLIGSIGISSVAWIVKLLIG